MAMVPETTAARTAADARAALARRLSQLQEINLGAEHAQRLRLLTDKLDQDQSVIAFCGHFSAGKSTLVNRLAGTQILPSSPIPTSANQVLIRYGSPGATIRFRDRGAVELPPSELDRIPALCADGAQVDSVEIRYPMAHVPEGLWVMDTPGIDSTDDAHRIVTESALYLADAVFYVMDYNHVQSEVNLQFTRELAEWGKPIYLVVNQIDKHVELEIPFAQFRQSVLQAFAGWGVRPAKLFFTSLREPDHPLNEWSELIHALQELGGDREALLLSGVWNSAVHLMAEEARQREQAEAGEREALFQDAGAGGPDPQVRREAVLAELERLKRQPAEVGASLLRDAGAILSNAPLFPHTTKELAGRYLESCKPGFKAGLFASAAKTRAEVEARLTALHADLDEKVKAHIHWHLEDLLLRAGEQYAGRNEAYEAEVRALTVALAPDMLSGLVKPQAVLAKEYLHQYIKDVTEEIQLRYRRAIKPLIDQVAALAEQRGAREAEPLRAEAETLTRALSARLRLTELTAAAAAFRDSWQAVLGTEPPARWEERQEEAVEAPAPEAAPQGEGAPPLGLEQARAGAPAAAQAAEGMGLRQEAARQLSAASGLLAPLPGMARAAADLEHRAQRLAESRFTVALFGAFSAGKSSFANALMGMQLLPVSPNPTTAVITKVTPPTAGRPHGLVHVVWKSAEQLRREVDRALSALGLEPTGDLSADLAAGARQSREATAAYAKPHAAFLAAAAQGYATVRHLLDTEEATGLAAFGSLVADERRSCFVAEVTVYVDCPVTRQGITLVDTPGADSINARHTDVAFDYIKNADAILFVTYYNHAFSRADSEFLTQLGRVKDAFALDKMFFVINAADLARDAEELDLVVGHVRSNLQACGIRQARIFPVSSQTALWSRLNGAGVLPRELAARLQKRLGAAADAADLTRAGLQASGMDRFEEAFYRFVITDLSQMAIDAGFAELRRSVRTVADWVEAARQDEGARTRRLQALQASEARASALIGGLSAEPEARELEREIDELLYYVRRRVLLERFREGFSQAFNPSVLRQDSPDIKRALREALQEVLEFVAFDLAQEMRATALRVENTANRQAERVAERVAAGVMQHLPQWSRPAFVPISLQVPAFSDGREHLGPAPFLKLLGLFRGPERFFAGGGRNQLAEELAKALEAPVAAYLAGARSTLSAWYGKAFSDRVDALQAELTASVGDHVGGLTAALTGAGDLAQLEAVLQELQYCM